MTFFKRYKNVKKSQEPIPDVFFFFLIFQRKQNAMCETEKKLAMYLNCCYATYF